MKTLLLIIYIFDVIASPMRRDSVSINSISISISISNVSEQKNGEKRLPKLKKITTFVCLFVTTKSGVLDFFG